jgi:hypothetical protein
MIKNILQIDNAKDALLNRLLTERLDRETKVAISLQIRALDIRRAALEQG